MVAQTRGLAPPKEFGLNDVYPTRRIYVRHYMWSQRCIPLPSNTTLDLKYHVLTYQYTKTISFHFRPMEDGGVVSYCAGTALVNLWDPYGECGSSFLYF